MCTCSSLVSRQNRIEHFAIVQKSKQNYTVSNFSILADTSLTYLNSDLLNGTLCVDWPVTYEKAFYEIRFLFASHSDYNSVRTNWGQPRCQLI